MDAHYQLSQLLSQQGYKMTQPRQRLFATLLAAGAPLTTSELIEQAPGLDKVTVYRVVALFERIGIVVRIWNGFKSKLELSEQFSPHHHHFTCVNCNRIITFSEAVIEDYLPHMEQQLGVKLTSHSVELRGQCSGCLAQEGKIPAQQVNPHKHPQHVHYNV